MSSNPHYGTCESCNRTYDPGEITLDVELPQCQQCQQTELVDKTEDRMLD